MHSILGLDIGGANLKAAHSGGQARSLAFPLWKEPALLGERVRRLVSEMPPAGEYALTLTGELCDCFQDQADGVCSILDSVERALAPASLRVWSLDGVFLTPSQARTHPAKVAAANWLAQATLVARLVPDRPALLIDIGSTTTDIIPLVDGKPCPTGSTDLERMKAGELVYTGARRTPVCAVLGPQVAAEFFATMADVYLVLDEVPPQPEHHDTADGRPATIENAHARLSRMMCADPATCPKSITLQLAQNARARQVDILEQTILKVQSSMPQLPEVLVASGSGAFVLNHLRTVASHLSLAERWGDEIAASACAWAVAVLASENQRTD